MTFLPAAISPGQPVTLTAAVASPTAGIGAATGSVTFVNTTTNTVLGTVGLTAGSATLQTSFATNANHAITAAYSGDAKFNLSSGTAVVPVSQNSSLAGYVFMDANNSGQRVISGVAKPGIPNVTITLLRTDAAAPAQTAVTQSDGSFHFDALAAGTYTLVETQPSQYISGGKDMPGTLTGGPNVSGHLYGAGSTSNSISGIELGAGQAGTEYDFGEYLMTRGSLTSLLQLASTPGSVATQAAAAQRAAVQQAAAQQAAVQASSALQAVAQQQAVESRIVPQAAMTEIAAGQAVAEAAPARQTAAPQVAAAEAVVSQQTSVQQTAPPMAVMMQAASTKVAAHTPVVQLGGSSMDFSASYRAGGSPVAIAAPTATIAKTGGGNLTSLTVTIAKLRDAGFEGFVVGRQTFKGGTVSAPMVAALATFPKITATYAAGVLTLTGGDSIEDYQNLLRSIQYVGTAVSPSTGPRVITVVAADAAGAGNTATTTISIAPAVATSLADQVLVGVYNWLTL